MKKNLLYLSCALMCMLGFLSSCKDDEKEIPPVVEDVVAQYTGDKVKVTLGGEAVSGDAQIDLVQQDDKSLTIKLLNIIPDVKEFSIPNAEFEATTRSAYISKLSGKASNAVVGYDVTFEGVVDEGVLTASITATEIKGDSINAKKAGLTGKTFKGKMTINVSNIPTPIEMEQRVYTSVVSKDTSAIKLKINDFAFQGLKLGDISLDTVAVRHRGEQDGKPIYGFKTKSQEMTLEAVGKVLIDANGTIIGEKMELSLNVNAVTAGLTVGVDFSGNIVEESTDTKATITVTGDAVAEGVTVSGNTYTFKVWESTPDDQLVFIPKIEIPATAVLDSIIIYDNRNKKVSAVEPNTAIDFSQLKENYYVGYHVTPEDIRYPSKKMLKMVRIAELNPVYDMATWVADGDFEKPNGLTTSNLAAAFFPMFGIDVPTPVVKASDNAAEITTSRTVSATLPSTLVPGVTAGTMFLGEFKVDITNTLKSTHFGVPYRVKPVNFKITYKYTPGTTFYKTVVKNNANDTEVVPNEKDECSINAYLYEVDSYAETLDGTNINTSNKVIMKAVLEDGSAKADYVTLTIPFKETGNGSFDPTKKKYKLAIVCSSSKKGDLFMGADGSKLWVKYLEVTR